MQNNLEHSKNPREQAILVRATSDAVDYLSKNRGKIDLRSDGMPIINDTSVQNRELIGKAIKDLNLEDTEKILYSIFLADVLKTLISRPN